MPNDSYTAAGRPLEADETDRLISSEKVDGTAVYNRAGDRLGTVHHLMLDKFGGRVEYAVMSFGGFLGIGEEYTPLPWRTLTCDTGTAGMWSASIRDRLERAPRYASNRLPDWSDRGYRERIETYWPAI